MITDKKSCINFLLAINNRLILLITILMYWPINSTDYNMRPLMLIA